MDPIEIAERVATLPAGPLLVIALIGIGRRWWVPGWAHADERRRADRFEAIVLAALDTTQAVARARRTGGGAK